MSDLCFIFTSSKISIVELSCGLVATRIQGQKCTDTLCIVMRYEIPMELYLLRELKIRHHVSNVCVLI